MRLWHKDLIPYLPRQQLLGQWRECCAIAKNIHDKGTPNHILVNRIMEYPAGDFITYAARIWCEIVHRGYKPNRETWTRLVENVPNADGFKNVSEIFYHWHNERYLQQCLHNLQEKYD